MDFSSKKEGSVPRLLQWGAAITTKMLATDLELCHSQKKAILDILDYLNDPKLGRFLACPPVPEKWKVACCLPYLLGSLDPALRTSSSGSRYRQKPVLVLATTKVTLWHLTEKMSSLMLDGSQLYFKTKGVLSDMDITTSGLYRTHVVETAAEVARVTDLSSHYDIILTLLQHYSAVPSSCFSEVFVYGNHQVTGYELNRLRSKFPADVPILLFTDAPYCHYQHLGACGEAQALRLKTPPLEVSAFRENAVCAGITLPTKRPVEISCLSEVGADWMSGIDTISQGPEVKLTLGAAPKVRRAWLKRSKSERSKSDATSIAIPPEDKLTSSSQDDDDEEDDMGEVKGMIVEKTGGGEDIEMVGGLSKNHSTPPAQELDEGVVRLEERETVHDANLGSSSSTVTEILRKDVHATPKSKMLFRKTFS